MAESSPNANLPMIRLQLLQPFLRLPGLQQRELERVFAEQRVSLATVKRSDVFVPAPAMYALVEGIADVSGDPYAGVHVGERVDLSSWAPVAEALNEACTIGDFLLRFTMVANKDASSVNCTLETRAGRSTYSERRIADFGLQPRHNDGFGIGYMSRILSEVLGDVWQGDAVVAQVCDPGAVPPAYRGMRVAGGDTLGFSLSFPTEWMLRPLEGTPKQHSSSQERSTPPRTLRESVERAIAPHIADEELRAARVAQLLGASERTLSRRLAQAGTSIGREIARIRIEKARLALTESTAPVAAIAAAVGYRDPAVFARAFKRQVGLTPTAFRSQHGRCVDV